MSNPMQQWAPYIGAGGQLIGAGMTANQIGRGNDLSQLQSNRLWLLAQGERQRRDAMIRQLMPSLYQGVGATPEQAQQGLSQLPSGDPNDPQYNQSYGPQLQSSSPGKVAQGIGYGVTGLSGLGAAKSAGLIGGTAGTAGGVLGPALGSAAETAAAGQSGLAAAGAAMGGTAGPGAAVGSATGGGAAGGGIGGALSSGLTAAGHGISSGLGAASNALGFLGLGSAALPVVGGLIGAGLLAKHFIGQGRKAANKEVQGVENPFGQGVLPQVLKTAQTDPNAARQQFIQGYNQYLSGENANIQKGGKDALVAQQSLTKNPQLKQTVESVAQQIGIPNFTFGRPIGG